MVNNYIISAKLCFLIIDRQIVKPTLARSGRVQFAVAPHFSKHPPSASRQTPSINWLCCSKSGVLNTAYLVSSVYLCIARYSYTKESSLLLCAAAYCVNSPEKACDLDYKIRNFHQISHIRRNACCPTKGGRFLKICRKSATRGSACFAVSSRPNRRFKLNTSASRHDPRQNDPVTRG